MWASANWGLSTILILIPLMLITVIACTLGTEKSWVSLSNSPLANWRSSSSLSIFTNSNNYNEQKNQSLSSIVGGVDDHVLFQHKLATKNPSEVSFFNYISDSIMHVLFLISYTYIYLHVLLRLI